jgi:small subunit ribosomal protein S1
VVVDLGDDVEGFIPRSQLEIPANEQVENYVRENMSLELRVIEFDGANRRIVLTPTQALERQPGEPPKRETAGESTGEPAAGEPSGDEAAGSDVEAAAAESDAEGSEPRRPVEPEDEPASQEQA